MLVWMLPERKQGSKLSEGSLDFADAGNEIPRISSASSPSLVHFQLGGIAKGGSSNTSIGFGVLISPASTSRAFSAAIRFSSSDAGSSSRSCSTSLPRTARLRNRLAQVLDLVGAGGQNGKRIDGKAGMKTKRRDVCVGCDHTRKAGFGQPIARVLTRGAGSLQPVAERHELIDLGDDAVLLSEGRERDWLDFELCVLKTLNRRPCLYQILQNESGQAAEHYL